MNLPLLNEELDVVVDGSTDVVVNMVVVVGMVVVETVDVEVDSAPTTMRKCSANFLTLADGWFLCVF